MFDSLARIITYQEFINSDTVGTAHKNQEDYEKMCPIQPTATYPEDDLEPLDSFENFDNSHKPENFDVS